MAGRRLHSPTFWASAIPTMFTMRGDYVSPVHCTLCWADYFEPDTKNAGNKTKNAQAKLVFTCAYYGNLQIIF